MKGDITRSTFRPERRYSSVRMQQGRVQLDADWNEQADIVNRRMEVGTVDVVGFCGGPIENAGFGISVSGSTIRISAGPYYCGGLLCENDTANLSLVAQPDLPGYALPTQNGVYVAYLDAWERHVTALEDPLLREVALGGPDTATRARILAQVRLLRVGNSGATLNCLSTISAWNSLVAASAVRLQARAEPGGAADSPCVVDPEAGYRRLENQLYRVEIHSVQGAQVTFKWSRDNGAIVSRWLGRTGNDLTVSDPGRDDLMAFQAGGWVELTDDARELRGESGTLVRLASVQGGVLTIDPGTASGTTNFADFGPNAKVRRWDSPGAVAVATPAANGGYLKLEDGVEIRFTAGSARVGDYWTIPARTATGQVEWPQDGANPAALPPAGIRHRYCRLALLERTGSGWTLLADCRDLFPNLTALRCLFYVSGDGQEAMPQPGQALTPLPQPLRVGVSVGSHRIAGARVRFRVDPAGGGQVEGQGEVVLPTGADGTVACGWSLGPTAPSQQVEATLLDAANNPVHLPIVFTANLSVAAQVAYQPGECPDLANASTVQQAIDILCRRPSGGGGCCEVTVGEEGDYARLDEALQDLVAARGERDVSICLMPGDHELPGGVSVSGAQLDRQLSLAIHGMGLGTRLTIASKSLTFSEMRSLSLTGIFATVSGTTSLLQIDRVMDVRIRDCYLRLSDTNASGVAVSIGQATRIEMFNTAVAAFARAQSDPTVGIARDFNPRLLEAIMSPGAAGGEIAIDLARDFAAEPAAGRRRIANDLTRLLRGANLEPEVATAFENVAANLNEVRINRELLEGNISLVRDFVASQIVGNAVAISDASADTHLSQNDLTGALLIGGGSAPLLSEAQIERVRSVFLRGGADFGGANRTLRVRDNRLQSIRLGNALTEALGNLSPNSPSISGAFRNLILESNTISSQENVLLARDVLGRDNVFLSGNRVAVAFARQASFVGNHGTDSSILVNTPQPLPQPMRQTNLGISF
jgi:hypothetical protein